MYLVDLIDEPQHYSHHDLCDAVRELSRLLAESRATVAELTRRLKAVHTEPESGYYVKTKVVK